MLIDRLRKIELDIMIKETDVIGSDGLQLINHLHIEKKKKSLLPVYELL